MNHNLCFFFIVVISTSNLLWAQSEWQEVKDVTEMASVLLNSQSKISWSFKKLGEYVIDTMKKRPLQLGDVEYLINGILLDKDGLATHTFILTIQKSKITHTLEGECSYRVSLSTCRI
jgi:hypothetical protein